MRTKIKPRTETAKASGDTDPPMLSPAQVAWSVLFDNKFFMVCGLGLTLICLQCYFSLQC